MAHHPDLKVFIVDDDIFCLTLYNQFLQNLGYTNVTSFTGGDECLDHMNAFPELIFLDYNMEGLNGVDVLKQIKKNNPSVIVFIITGKEDPIVAAEAIKYGAMDYVVKSSLSPDKMKAIMQKVENVYIENPASRGSKKSFFNKIFK
jgi:DNA-binding NtrC family response regulator